VAKAACEKVLGLVDNVHWGAIMWKLRVVRGWKKLEKDIAAALT
jgi:hypothetical protein